MARLAFHVFLSHDSADYALVDRVWHILTRMRISAYMYEKYPQFGEYLPETIKQVLKASKFVVVFFTQNGVTSQWVNQEVGIAMGITPAFQSIVIPVHEMGVEVKGFTGQLLHIDYDPHVPEDMISHLIYALRTRLSLHEGTLTLDCRCGHSFEGELPSFSLVSTSIEKSESFFWKCDKCSRTIVVSPRTLEITGFEEPYFEREIRSWGSQ